jgi:hypothetical protein
MGRREGESLLGRVLSSLGATLWFLVTIGGSGIDLLWALGLLSLAVLCICLSTKVGMGRREA